MHKRCISGSFFSTHAPEFGNEAKHGTDIPTRPGEASEVAPAIAGSNLGDLFQSSYIGEQSHADCVYVLGCATVLCISHACLGKLALQKLQLAIGQFLNN